MDRLEIIMLSEICQTQKIIAYFVSYIPLKSKKNKKAGRDCLVRESRPVTREREEKVMGRQL